MDRYKAPRDKLLCLVNVKTMVENIVGLAAKAGASIGGEWARRGRFVSSWGCFGVLSGVPACWGACLCGHPQPPSMHGALEALLCRTATRRIACCLAVHTCTCLNICVCSFTLLQALTLSFPSSCLWSSAPGCRTWPQTSSERDRAACTLSSSSCLPSRLASISCARKPPWPPASSMPAHLLTWEPAGLPAFPSLCRRYVKRFRARARLSGQFDYMLANLVSAWARACAGWSRLR